MAQNQNKSSLLRIVIPFAVGLVGLLVIIGLMQEPADNASDKQAEQNNAQKQSDADGKGKPEPAKQDADPRAIAPADLTDTQQKIGLREDDVILSVNGKAVEDFTDVATEIAKLTSGTIQIEIERAGKKQTLTYAADDTAARPDTQAPDDADPAEPEADPLGPLENLRPAFVDKPAKVGEPGDLITIGSDDPESDYEVFAQINPYRAGVHRVSLTHEYHDVEKLKHYVLLHPIDLNLGDTKYPLIGSYAAEYLVINGEKVKLFDKDEKSNWSGHWEVVSKKQSSVTLSLTIQGGPGDAPIDVAKITRTYRVAPGSHTVDLDQRIENLTQQELNVQWQQLAQGDVHHEANDYLRGRSLHYVTGYFDDDYDKDHFSIYVEDGFITRTDLISDLLSDLKKTKEKRKWSTVWPNPKVDSEDKLLAWLASENRYFVAVSSPDVDPQTVETGDVPALESIYPKITTKIYPEESQDSEISDEKRIVLFGLISKTLTLEPGETSDKADLSLDLFVGPREDDIFAQAPYKAMHFEKTIRYSLGGFCGVCTFQWLARLLLGFLELLHMGVMDWGVAIVILVLCVRILLHPITKRGQINMMKMGKQMAAVQPELNKLKKKYADEPREMQQAQMQLFREKGINPAAGAMGCLPMLLQMPIWIALYATLYYAIELRHEHAFYGVFQLFNNWPFLSDLSAADRFIPLFANDGGHVLELLFIRLDYSSINILPLLMGVTFYINMKFTTPPPMNEQQATQQKIMRFMPLLFPFFLYSAPAGLTLYICASTLAGIVDSYIVRKHIKELEESGELFKPSQRKSGGFMEKIQKAAEARAAQMEEVKKQQQQNKGPQSYKKRRKK